MFCGSLPLTLQLGLLIFDNLIFLRNERLLWALDYLNSS